VYEVNKVLGFDLWPMKKCRPCPQVEITPTTLAEIIIVVSKNTLQTDIPQPHDLADAQRIVRVLSALTGKSYDAAVRTLGIRNRLRGRPVVITVRLYANWERCVIVYGTDTHEQDPGTGVSGAWIYAARRSWVLGFRVVHPSYDRHRKACNRFDISQNEEPIFHVYSLPFCCPVSLEPAYMLGVRSASLSVFRVSETEANVHLTLIPRLCTIV
jgi:hypothetical protein